MPKLYKEILPITRNDTIAALTEFRDNNYQLRFISPVTEAHFPEIKNWVLELGTKILRVNATNLEEINVAQSQFAKIVDVFFQTKNKFAICSFAAQLLQYYTVISHARFTSEFNAIQFREFLKEHEKELGSVENNSLITEYRLIKIYNDLTDCLDSINGVKRPIPDVNEKLGFLLGELNTIQEKINQWIYDAPDNVFIAYLKFVVSYACAKALELQHKLIPTEEREQKEMVAGSQRFFLQDCLQGLKNIQSIQTLSAERGHTFVKGAELSLGQNVLIKLPVSDLDAITSHVSSLLEASSSVSYR
ncbi:hypothetical protein Lade_0856 [Legionella adelaidensis]|uniref:Uncharacterized protein n=1 Tax=Legionella adelaidensis TaxID=45056 RepID=A0A0W0R543_9GAMM|nr:hypothetical protein [Legionella adelaidensis]KTC66198.1 hypothetical protein Lade_0856 [Legionella adelaidensis]